MERFGFAENQIWVVFCCPPYALWESEGDRILNALNRWWESAPSGSLFAIELEESTPIKYLPTMAEWDIRVYKPALMAIAEKP
jgi:hypothetical protein